MIKRMLLSLAVLYPALVQAQIVLDSADMGSIGQSVIMKYDYNYNGTVGSPGPSQVWDFSSLAAAPGVEDTVRFLSQASIPGGPTVPNANMVMQVEGQNMYVEKTASKVDILAINMDMGPMMNGIQELNPPLRYIDFPATYLDNQFSSTSFQVTVPFDTTVTVPIFGNVDVDSIRVTVAYFLYDTINGYGTLELPSGIEPALRQHSRQVISLSGEAGANIPFVGFTWVPFPLPVPDMYSSTFRYYGKGKKYPLLEILTDSAGNIESTSYQDQSVTSVSDLKLRSEQISVFPNPAADRVFINNEMPAAITVQVYDLMGKKVQADETLYTGRSTIDLGRLSTGTYLLRFIDTNGEVVSWQKLVKQ